MAYIHLGRESAPAMNVVHAALLSFPIACFTLTALTDLAYVSTENLLWLHFSEWLLVAGLVFGVIELLVVVVESVFRKVRPLWLAAIGGIAVILLATVNSLVHTADGWSAVMPTGIILSILTVFAMIVTAWLSISGRRHV